jgi:hypothetical protein
MTTTAKINPETNVFLGVMLLDRRRGSNLEDRIFHPIEKCPGAEMLSRHHNFVLGIGDGVLLGAGVP